MNLRKIIAVTATVVIVAVVAAQSPTGRLSETEKARLLQEGRRVLALFGFDAKTPLVDFSGKANSKVSLEYDGATVFIDRATQRATYISLDKLRQSFTLRARGQSLIKRSEAGWSSEGLRKANDLWPQVQLQLRKATRYPESGNDSIGRMSATSNSINLEYRGTLGKRRIRVDLVFDQVTGALVTARLVDEPKPR